MFKPSYRYNQDGVKDGSKKIRNPFDNKIIVIDEIHKLLTDKTEKQTQRDMLVLMLKYARDSVVIGLTATPLVKEDTSKSAVLDLIKGPDSHKKNNEGYISYFNELVHPLFPTTIPGLFQRIHGGKIPVLGRVILSPLYGPNFEKYLDRVQNLRGNPSAKPSTKDMIALQTFLNTIYTNGSAGKHGANWWAPKKTLPPMQTNWIVWTSCSASTPLRKRSCSLRAAREVTWNMSNANTQDGSFEEKTRNPSPKRTAWDSSLACPIRKGQGARRFARLVQHELQLEREYIRVMCANAKRFGTGVNFVEFAGLYWSTFPTT